MLGGTDSGRYVARLRAGGDSERRAVRELHTLLVRMAYASLRWRHPELRGAELQEVALEAADDAVVRVLAHLEEFRGASRFTTWACRFAVTEASVAARRHRRHLREVPVEPDAIVELVGSGTSVEHEQAELLRLVCEGVSAALTARQRDVLVALAVDGDSPDELAAALGTTPGALYKCLYDARRKLRVHLAQNGLTPAGNLPVAV